MRDIFNPCVDRLVHAKEARGDAVCNDESYLHGNETLATSITSKPTTEASSSVTSSPPRIEPLILQWRHEDLAFERWRGLTQQRGNSSKGCNHLGVVELDTKPRRLSELSPSVIAVDAGLEVVRQHSRRAHVRVNASGSEPSTNRRKAHHERAEVLMPQCLLDSSGAAYCLLKVLVCLADVVKQRRDTKLPQELGVRRVQAKERWPTLAPT